MTTFSKSIGIHVEKELALSLKHKELGEIHKEFEHIENAQVLGQASTYYHVYVHWKMLQWGIRQRSIGEITRQMFRVLGAATMTAIGWVPEGNTGGSNISPFKHLPIEPILARTINNVKKLNVNHPMTVIIIGNYKQLLALFSYLTIPIKSSV